MNHAGVGRERRKRILRQLDDAVDFLPTRAQAETVYAHYRDSNVLLNERFGISAVQTVFDEDFSRYPESESMRWTEEGANQALVNVLTAFEAVPVLAREDANALLKLAGRLEESNLTVAKELVNITAKYYPNLPRVKRKLTKYENPEPQPGSAPVGLWGRLKKRFSGA